MKCNCLLIILISISVLAISGCADNSLPQTSLPTTEETSDAQLILDEESPDTEPVIDEEKPDTQPPDIEAFMSNNQREPFYTLAELTAMKAELSELFKEEYYTSRVYLAKKYKPLDLTALGRALYDMKQLPWKYEAGYYDCTEMSALVELYLEAAGFDTVIVVSKDIKFQGAQHAWVAVIFEQPVFRAVPVEVTKICVPELTGNTYGEPPNEITMDYDDYLRDGWILRDIYEAMIYRELEFDWWNSYPLTPEELFGEPPTDTPAPQPPPAPPMPQSPPPVPKPPPAPRPVPTIPTVPQLLSPADGATLPPPGSPWTFDWADSYDSAGIRWYQIYVIAAGLPNPIIDTYCTSSFCEKTIGYMIEANRYEWTWKVRAQSNAGAWSDWSKIRTFKVEAMVPPPPPAPTPTPLPLPPVLITPEEGAVLDNGRLDWLDDITWDFDWSDCDGATTYHIYVIGANAIYPVIDKYVTVSSYQHIGNGYIIEQNSFGWTWKVRARVDGQWTQWSEVRAFDVELVNTDAADMSGFVEQESYTSDCLQRPEGTVCLSFSDGYIWLINDSVTGRTDSEAGNKRIRIVFGGKARYYHILDTNLVMTISY